MRSGLPGSLAAHLLQESMVWISEASQWPKIITPIVKMVAPIQIKMAAFFSEMVGFVFMTR
jgi:hypothetical protein